MRTKVLSRESLQGSDPSPNRLLLVLLLLSILLFTYGEAWKLETYVKYLLDPNDRMCMWSDWGPYTNYGMRGLCQRKLKGGFQSPCIGFIYNQKYYSVSHLTSTRYTAWKVPWKLVKDMFRCCPWPRYCNALCPKFMTNPKGCHCEVYNGLEDNLYPNVYK